MFAMAVFDGVKTSADPIYSFTTINFPGASETAALGINNSGQIVGSFNVFSALMTHGFLDTGSFTTVDVPGVTGGTSASGINNRGQIVGTFAGTGGFAQGFLETGGSFSNIDFPGAQATLPRGINDSGQIVGYFNDTSGIHGFLDTGGSFSTINVPGAFRTFALGINNSGQIVGIYYMTLPRWEKASWISVAASLPLISPGTSRVVLPQSTTAARSWESSTAARLSRYTRRHSRAPEFNHPGDLSCCLICDGLLSQTRSITPGPRF
jgi:uncharacterized membrane protein